MSHKLMVYSERPIKTRTLDLMHKAELARRDTSQRPIKARAPRPRRQGNQSRQEAQVMNAKRSACCWKPPGIACGLSGGVVSS